MANVKTAISLPEPLFEQAESLAHELNTSRSHLFVLALEEFIRRHQNRQLLQQLNAAYGEGLDLEEERLLRAMRHSYRHLVEDDAW